MAPDGVPRHRGSPKTVEQLLHSDNPSAWSASSGLGKIHDQEEYPLHHTKKLSVLARVKENARKWRQSIGRKKSGHDSNHTPSWGVALEDYEVDEDAEHHGAPAYQSWRVSKTSKDNGKHSPVNDTMCSDKHSSSNITIIRPGNLEPVSLRRRNKTVQTLAKSHSHHEGTSTITKVTIDETPRARSFRHFDRENFRSLNTGKTIYSEYRVEHPSESKTTFDSRDQEPEKPAHSPRKASDKVTVFVEEVEGKSPTKTKAITQVVSEATSKITSKIQGLTIGSLVENRDGSKLDKGVSVTDYLKSKLEPGEDERALSQVITEVISPRRSPSEKGVMEKMKTAVTLLLQNEEPSTSSSLKTSDSYAHIPVSTNAHEVEEENQGRILQAN